MVRTASTRYDLFYTGAGHRMMFVESEIMMRVLLRLKEAAIVALPVFDAVIVKASSEEHIKQVMMELFTAATGLGVLVNARHTVEPTWYLGALSRAGRIA
ncbi:MAG: hypothetical protein ABWY64_17480 [Tardiphaga sp.]|jgi:hypothetical protein